MSRSGPKQLFRGLAVAVSTGLSLACQEGPSLTSPTPGIASRAGIVAVPTEMLQKRFKTRDDYFLELVNQAPGFGGLFLDKDGALRVYLTELS